MVHCWPLGMKVLARYLVFSDTPLAGVPGRSVGVPYQSLVEYRNLGSLCGQKWAGKELVFSCAVCLEQNSQLLSTSFPSLLGCSFLALLLDSVGFCWGFFFFFLSVPIGVSELPLFPVPSVRHMRPKGNPGNSLSWGASVPRSLDHCLLLSTVQSSYDFLVYNIQTISLFFVAGIGKSMCTPSSWKQKFPSLLQLLRWSCLKGHKQPNLLILFQKMETWRRQVTCLRSNNNMKAELSLNSISSGCSFLYFHSYTTLSLLACFLSHNFTFCQSFSFLFLVIHKTLYHKNTLKSDNHLQVTFAPTVTL